MVDILRSGTDAARAAIGGIGGGAGFSIITDGRVTSGELADLVVIVVVLMATFITLHAYYEWRRGEAWYD